MSQPLINARSTGGLAVGVQPSSLPSREFVRRTREQELELNLAELQSNYADLHAALFEACRYIIGFARRDWLDTAPLRLRAKHSPLAICPATLSPLRTLATR